jgi:uncharacterized membrane protein
MNNSAHDTFPDTTQLVGPVNRMVAIPLVATETLATAVLKPAIYAVLIEHVIVMLDVVLLKTLITSPSAKVELGIVTLPPEPT